MTDLIARIESAEGPSYALDREIGEAMGRAFAPPQPYTASIDAALTLVPEGWSYVIRPGYVGLRHPRNPENDVTSWANDSALALAAAALKARSV